MLKNLLAKSISGTLLLMVGTACAQSGPTAQQLVSAAEVTARKEHKNVFVVFHASWCGWCHKLEKLMGSADYKPLFETNYEVVWVDIAEHDAQHPETLGGEALAKQLGAADQGLPFYTILNPNGKTLGDSRNGKAGNIGYPGEPGEVTYFMGLLKSSAPHASDQQLENLEAYLRKK